MSTSMRVNLILLSLVLAALACAWDSGDPWDKETSSVEYYPANDYGLYDMDGKVWEWVDDWSVLHPQWHALQTVPR